MRVPLVCLFITGVYIANENSLKSTTSFNGGTPVIAGHSHAYVICRYNIQLAKFLDVDMTIFGFCHHVGPL
jgi:hypothetical protein